MMEIDPFFDRVKVNVMEINKKFKIYMILMLLINLIPQSIILYYFYIVDNKLTNFISTFNETNYISYVNKIEHLIDYVCNQEKVCK